MGMKLIVAGGRGYALMAADERYLDLLHSSIGISEIVHGGCTGADSGAEAWARRNDIPTKCFPAEWDKHGRAAGPIRNQAMASYVGNKGGLLLFPGGRGTASMRKIGTEMGIQTFEPHKSAMIQEWLR